MVRRNSISGGGDWRRDAAFIGISIAVIVATILILIRSGLASSRYETPPNYPLYLVISELIYLAQLLLVGLRLSIIFNRGHGL